MAHNNYKLRGRVWLYQGMAGWHFVTLPKKQSVEIRKKFDFNKRGWGSQPVKITIGQTQFKTSIFPDKKIGTYLLPLKAEVRKKEKINVGDNIKFDLEIII
jgi:hypothetical protein